MVTKLTCQTKDEFDAKLKEDGKLVVVDFFATWCGPCKVIAPKIEEFANKYGEVRFYKVDVDELADVAEAEGIEAMPTFIFYKDGKKVDSIRGANAAKIEEYIQKYK